MSLLVHKHGFDAILSGIFLPDMDEGFHLIEEMQEYYNSKYGHEVNEEFVAMIAYCIGVKQGIHNERMRRNHPKLKGLNILPRVC